MDKLKLLFTHIGFQILFHLLKHFLTGGYQLHSTVSSLILSDDLFTNTNFCLGSKSVPKAFRRWRGVKCEPASRASYFYSVQQFAALLPAKVQQLTLCFVVRISEKRCFSFAYPLPTLFLACDIILGVHLSDCKLMVMVLICSLLLVKTVFIETRPVIDLIKTSKP